MNKLNSPEHIASNADKLTAVALFAGVIAVGAAFLKHIFGASKKSGGK